MAAGLAAGEFPLIYPEVRRRYCLSSNTRAYNTRAPGVLLDDRAAPSLPIPYARLTAAPV